MRFQNRVNPEGEICFSSEKGTLMGNRGCLHDDEQKTRKCDRDKRELGKLTIDGRDANLNLLQR